jgi:superfamily I DNA/RNA helicase
MGFVEYSQLRLRCQRAVAKARQLPLRGSLQQISCRRTDHVSTVHKAKGLEWPRVSLSSDFNQFVNLEGDKPVTDLEEAYIMYVALTRARDKLLLSPASAEVISASAAAKTGRTRQRASTDAESRAQLHGIRHLEEEVSLL